MTATRVRDLLALAVLAGVATWILVSTFYGSVPPVSPFAGASLYPVAALLVGVGLLVRSRVRGRRVGPGPGQLHPITVARAAALAKAAALVGAAAAGVWAGFLVHLLPLRSTLRAASEDTPGAVVGLVAGIAAVAAALWLEHSCRTPDDTPDEPAQ
ncbi:hypothetical protein ASG56_07845 [Rhodococcus sp. Leaf7]|uniref:DUF3180 domain-containing protein n=1 Tax=unclassified Rhodococcus (in: high G+C Gram-positive bacteria) TaxID=192944 RepID=UPI0005ACD788|nr:MULTISPECIES: DUF3180 domain-containing protein [unclassified Rhodococcus (in: high G+C Gram-positive bacteria)]KIQ18201.1 membrane protein [Rhodococcus sp. MEB064]KQU07411.1 hypothetical protein ASG56_07845 [Rhodococcus sp. Leaf7]KQU42931.1 hypothetical protein ASG64_07845 [Rhodococcus sp. Leaf247]